MADAGEESRRGQGLDEWSPRGDTVGPRRAWPPREAQVDGPNNEGHEDLAPEVHRKMYRTSKALQRSNLELQVKDDQGPEPGLKRKSVLFES